MKVGVGFRVGKLRVTGLARDGNQEQRRWRVICDCGAVEERGERNLIAAKNSAANSSCKRCHRAAVSPYRRRMS